MAAVASNFFLSLPKRLLTCHSASPGFRFLICKIRGSNWVVSKVLLGLNIYEWLMNGIFYGFYRFILLWESEWSEVSEVAQLCPTLPNREDPLEKEMAVHSSTIAWKIPWTEEPGRLQSMGTRKELDTTERLHVHVMDLPGGSDGKSICLQCWRPVLSPGWGTSPGEGNGNPLQYSCLENHKDGEAW